jgi:anti-sigma factor RsiW
MTVRNQCLEEVDLVAYLYDDVDARDGSAVAAHVATCAACADEVRALQATRDQLQTWVPPDVSLGFQVVAAQRSAAPEVLRPAPWWRQPLPAWAQVAAAVLLFSAGAALGAFRGTTAGVAKETGMSTASATAASATTPVSAGDLAALEQRLRAEMAARPDAPTPTVASRQSDEALLQQVRTLISESERRQQQELTLRTAELVKDVDAQRRGDLARIERTFGQMEGTTGVQVEQQRQLLNYLMRVSQRQPQ